MSFVTSTTYEKKDFAKAAKRKYLLIDQMTDRQTVKTHTNQYKQYTAEVANNMNVHHKRQYASSILTLFHC
jgi:hypothetical protein